MNVRIDSWAWLDKNELSPEQVARVKKELIVRPRKVGNHPGPDPEPLHLYADGPDFLGVPRQYFFQQNRHKHTVDLCVNATKEWEEPLSFSGQLRGEQAQALEVVVGVLRGGNLGGILQAVPGWGKTVWACALMARLKVPTLVVVHKEFLMDQWMERIGQFLPGASVGLVQQDKCDIVGRHIALAMLASLSCHEYDESLYRWPGMVLVDEVHRIGSHYWSQVPPKFPTRWMLGLSATPRRKDRADKVFLYHIGEIIFKATEKRLAFKVKKVYTSFRVVKTPNFNPALMSEGLLLRFLCKSSDRNRKITGLLVDALKAERKVMVLSSRLKHLHRLKELIEAEEWVKPPTVGFYVGGMSKKARKESEECQLIFATTQMCTEALDIPPLDTLFLVTPLGDVEQAVGRILRPVPGKKDPIVVDVRDEEVEHCRKLASYRDRQYTRMMA